MNATSPQQGAVAPRESAGAILAAARRDAGLEIADVCNRLRVSAAQIEALEADHYERLPGATFIRGIIRSYAKILEVDAQPALDAYARRAPAAVANAVNVPTQNIRFEPGARPRFNVPVSAGLALLALAVAGLGAWLWYTAPKAEESVAKNEIQEGAPVSTAADATATLPTESPAEPPAATPPAIGAEPLLTAPSEAAPVSDATLRFKFAGSSWVEVKDGRGEVLLSRTNPRGSEQNVTGQPPFSLIIGNARLVTLTYDDKPIDLAPHTEAAIARLTLQSP